MPDANLEGKSSTPVSTDEGENFSLEEKIRRDQLEIKRLLDQIGTKSAIRCLQRFHVTNHWGNCSKTPRTFAELVSEIGTTYTLLCLRLHLEHPNSILTR